MTSIALIISEKLVYYFARDLGVLSICHDNRPWISESLVTMV